MTVYF